MSENVERKKYDVVVVGAGSGGLTASVGFAKAGKRVLLVEKNALGGECTNAGCIPSKALLHHAKTYYHAKKIAGETALTEAYRENALQYVTQKIEEVRATETVEEFGKMGIDVVFGDAEFVSPCSLRVKDITYQYKRAVIATGSKPRQLEKGTVPEEDVLTNQNIFSLTSIPEKLLVIGGGAISMELGQAFAFLGSEVTMLLREGALAERYGERVSKILTNQFEKNGITILTNTTIIRAENKTAHVKKQAEGVDETATLQYDKVLVAIGRVPVMPEGLDVAGIISDSACIQTDGQYRTSNKYVFAVGDVALQKKFTHTADDAARQVVTYVLSHGLVRPNRHKSVPAVIYTEPELAVTGYSFGEACKKYDCGDLLRIELPYSKSDRAITDAVEMGYLSITARKVSGTILGATVVGQDAGSLISLTTLAIDRKITLWRLRSVIFPYPTHTLLLKKAGDIFLKETITNLKVDLLRKIKKSAPKIFALMFWLVLIIAFQWYKSTSDYTYLEMAKLAFDTVTTTMWGPFVYMLFYAIRPLIFFPATILTALSGALFGLPLGILYTVLGENASANFAYWIGRYFGAGFHLEDTAFGNWVTALRKRPFGTVLFMRLFYVPFDLTNYGSGAIGIPWVSYFFATLIGIMPGLITFVALGAGIEDITNFMLTPDAFNFVNIGIGVATFVISLVVARLLRRWKPKDA